MPSATKGVSNIHPILDIQVCLPGVEDREVVLGILKKLGLHFHTKQISFSVTLTKNILKVYVPRGNVTIN